MNTNQIRNMINEGSLDEKLASLYGASNVATQRARYLKAVDSFESIYGDREDVGIYSVSGRSELSGNHTDHNHGCVIAASINLDIIAVAAKNDDGLVRLRSEGYTEDKMTFTYRNALGDMTALVANCEAVLDDGEIIDVKDMLGFAEKVKNRW